MSAATTPEHRYPGARAMIDLHEHHLRSFLATWKRARAADLALPPTKDPDYVSLDALLFHVLACARGYMVWMCEVLELPAPDMAEPPERSRMADEADTFIEQVAAGWKTPLIDVDEERFNRPEHPSRWKVLYCVDAMMEHAVMHPIRHEFQLQKMMNSAAQK